jgi:hypothetical protein
MFYGEIYRVDYQVSIESNPNNISSRVSPQTSYKPFLTPFKRIPWVSLGYNCPTNIGQFCLIQQKTYNLHINYMQNFEVCQKYTHSIVSTTYI